MSQRKHVRSRELDTGINHADKVHKVYKYEDGFKVGHFGKVSLYRSWLEELEAPSVDPWDFHYTREW